MNEVASMSALSTNSTDIATMKNLLELNAARQHAYQSAASALGQAKIRHGAAQPHRSLGRMIADPYRVTQALILPITLCMALVWAEPLLVSFWQACVLFWASHLGLPLQATSDASDIASLALTWNVGSSPRDMPSQEIWLATAGLTLAIVFASSKCSADKLPLKYLVRVICVIQMISLLYFLVAPSRFPYSVGDHMADIAHVGFTLMFVTPIMLTLGYYLLNVRSSTKLLHTLLILAYFLLLIPHQIVLHALILHHGSMLFMPLLYICFGAVFDVLVFVALYSWAASTLPVQTTV